MIGALAIRNRQRARANASPEYNPELEAFKEQQLFIAENLKCNVKFFKSVIPPGKGKLEGVLTLEAKQDIEHNGMFILMKGLPLVPKKSMSRKPLINIRFTVLANTSGGVGGGAGVGGEGELTKVEGGSKDSYPLELDLPEEFPPPLITSGGKLIYRMQAFVTTLVGRHVAVGEVSIRWRGCKVLSREEVDKELRIEQQIASKRDYLRLGKRSTCGMEWRLEKGGYLPGEVIRVELYGEAKDKGGMEVEFRVELVQKVWYQVPAQTGRGKMWVNMKVNVLAAQESGESLEVPGAGAEGGGDEDGEREGGKVLVWVGGLRVPKGITPTWKYDFMNTVSYVIRVSCGAAGESRDGWVKGEGPVLIGTSREGDELDEAKRMEAEGGGGEEEDDEDEEEEELEVGLGSPQVVMRRRGSGDSGHSRRSRSMFFMPSWRRPRAGSVSSMGSCSSLASSTLSMFRLPPSYSQLSSRRPTLETLPPAYDELEMQMVMAQSKSSEEIGIGAQDDQPSRPSSATDVVVVEDMEQMECESK